MYTLYRAHTYACFLTTTDCTTFNSSPGASHNVAPALHHRKDVATAAERHDTDVATVAGAGSHGIPPEASSLARVSIRSQRAVERPTRPQRPE